MNSLNLEPGTPTRLEIKFDKDITNSLKLLLKLSELPTSPPIHHSNPWDLGIELSWLKKLKERLESDDWRVQELEGRINKYPNYFVRMKASSNEDERELVDVHFLHVRSSRLDAIPLVMQHGWPGTFWDFHKVIEPLVEPPLSQPAFHLIIPSLPGFFLSTHPKHREWGLVENAKLIHRLVTEVLGYDKYAGQAGDWGYTVFHVIGNLYPTQVPLIHFNGFVCPPVAGIPESSFTERERRALRRNKHFQESGSGYFQLQSTKPFTIGYCLQSSPLGQLAYIGEKFQACSDPTTLDDNDVLDTVALYYLSRSFATSVLIYQEYMKIRSEMPAEKVKSTMGFTLFPYEILGQPKAYLEAIGPLAFYKERSVGGHFPALDNPEGLVEDVRDFIGKNWSAK
ncbi:hypothetical protein M422DRAFT_255731 [Sphaerobolus stellatus SS14]|uniref:Epoxide hydrolase N-terminal domain-containing protein n=1 Tax=Sphaerobolus stellatus (strain SS14) TaxID=990650 RepID=A0A0C9VT20_SPHS4|nr:hypothetical protein M422DRAFT_255731 [Sphaerobolus stellatus SS14]